MKEPFIVNSELDSNLLKICVELNTEEVFVPNEGNYTYRLKRNGNILETIENSSDNSCMFSLNDYGEYFVLVTCKYKGKNYWRNSKLIFYFPSFPNEYKEFLSKMEPCLIPQLDYTRPVYPHQDFILINMKNKNEDYINGFVDRYGLHKDTISLQKGKGIFGENLIKCEILTTSPVQKVGDTYYAFSGITRSKKHLIIGYNDLIKYQIHPQSLHNEVGDYYVVYYDSNGIYFDHDYLGLSKIYYYKHRNDFIVSNRYHLLLLVMKSIGIYPEVNKERAIADLSSTSAFARMNYSRKMIIHNTFSLPIDQTFCLTADSIQFPYTTLHEELVNPEPFSEKEYPLLIKKAKEELLDNARIALEHPNYDYYILDLSGGVDSRVVYSIITHFPEYHDKIRINTVDLPHYPLDLPIALELNSLYGFKYNDYPITIVPKSLNSTFRDNISSCLGVNQQITPTREYSYSQRTMKLPGFLGELYTRPHMYTKFKGNIYEDDITVEEFVKNREYYYSVAISQKGLHFYQKIFTEELKSIPGDTPMVKLQNHYLFYMESIHHCTYQGMIVNNRTIWPVIQSKTLFHLNNVTAMVFRNNRLAFDILFQLNPAIASIPYEKKLYMDERMEMAKEHPNLGRIIRLSEETIAIERKKWETANKDKNKNTIYEKIDDRERDRINRENEEHKKTIECSVLYALRKIIQFSNGEIGNVIGLDCFSRIYGSMYCDDGRGFLHYLYVKILSLYYELRIFGYIE